MTAGEAAGDESAASAAGADSGPAPRVASGAAASAGADSGATALGVASGAAAAAAADSGATAPRVASAAAASAGAEHDARAWSDFADEAQQGLTRHFQSRVFGARWLHNTAPLRLAHLTTFNYWWLAHAVEVRVDGAERRGIREPPAQRRGTSEPPAERRGTREPPARWRGTSEPPAERRGSPQAHGAAQARRVHLAENTYAGIRCRNRGLFNHYFDDMGWLAIAAVRMFDLTGEARHLADAESLWEHIRDRGGSLARPGAIAWRDSQLDYLNAPTNGAFAILSARLATRTEAPRYEAAAEASLGFFTEAFVGWQGAALAAATHPGPADLVADGINRLGDGGLDSGWLFTYNQGLYLGALVEAFDRTGSPELLERATRTAAATIARLAPSGRFLDEPARLSERGGGDAGLFKGIFVRYLELLLERLAPGSSGLRMLEPFFVANTDLLAAPARAGALVADDWAAAPGRTTALTTQLAAVIAVEARARYEHHRAER